MNRESAGSTLISAQLLVLQSKRLMLASAERRLGASDTEALRHRVDGLRQEADRAHGRYEEMVLEHGSAQTAGYWLVAYRRLIDSAETVRSKLRSVASQGPARDRFAIAAEVEALEHMLEGWSSSMRETIAEAAS